MPTPVKSEPPARRFSLGPGHFDFVGILTLRLWDLARLAHSSLLLPSRGDMHFYNDWAREILRGHVISPLAFYGLPGYAYFLAFLYKIFGENPFFPGLIQAGADAGTGALIYATCVRLFASVRSTSFFAPKLIGLIGVLGWAFFV